MEGLLKSLADERKDIRTVWKEGEGLLKYNTNGVKVFVIYFLNSVLHGSCCLENIFDFEGIFPQCSTICCIIKFSILF